MKLAICTPVNEQIPISNNKGIAYIYQYIAFVQSIKDNIHSVEYDIYVFNTKPFSEEYTERLESMGVKILTRPTDFTFFNRPEIYLEDLGDDYDYRLVTDCDMIFCSDITPEHVQYIQQYDALAMYGHQNISAKTYREICTTLNLNVPPEIIQAENTKDRRNFTAEKNLKYHFTPDCPRLFPYFNNGVIMIKNSMSQDLGKLWKQARATAAENYKWMANKKSCGIVLTGAGQLTMGLCISHLTQNWAPLPRGFNVVVTPLAEKFTKLDNMIASGIQPVLLHYIAAKYNMPIYKRYLDYYLKPFKNNNASKNNKPYNKTLDHFFGPLPESYKEPLIPIINANAASTDTNASTSTSTKNGNNSILDKK